MQDYSLLYDALVKFRELFQKKMLDERVVDHSKDFLRQIRNTKPHNWTYNDAFRVYGIIKPYRTQLKLIGFDFSGVPEIALPVQAVKQVQKKDSIIGYDGNKFIIHFEFSTKVYNAIKTIPGAKFDPDKKYWTVPITSVKELKQFGLGMNFQIGDAALRMMNNVHDNLENSYSSEYIELNLPLKKTLYGYQTQGVEYLSKNRAVICADQMRLGKALVEGSKVFTANGFINIENALIGTRVFAADGDETIVTGYYPQGQKECYKITFSDNTTVECCGEHLWEIYTPDSKYRTAKNRIWSTEKILKQGLTMANGNRKYYLPLIEPVILKPKEFYIQPYLMGLLLGDGSFRGHRVTFTSADAELIHSVNALLPTGYYTRQRHNPIDYDISHKFNGISSPLLDELKRYGLWHTKSGTKFIPQDYLYGSIEQRTQLLRGLMDTDGYVNKDGNCAQYTTVSKRLCNDIVHLIQSLGGIATVTTKTPKRGQLAYTITVRLTINPFALKRKADRVKARTKFFPARSIVNIESIGLRKCYCIAIQDERKLFAINDFILTHNTPQSIGAVLKNDSFPCLVIVPKTLRLNWQDEWEGWTNKKVIILNKKNIKKLPQLIEAGLCDVAITNYNGIETFFVTEIKNVTYTTGPNAGLTYEKVITNELELLFNSVILDEGHHVRNPRTRRFKCVKKCFKNKQDRFILSGTPIVKGPQDLAALLELIGRIEEFGGRHKFLETYRDFDKQFLNSKNTEKSSHALRELNVKLRSLCFIRRERWQIPNVTPEKYRKVIRCELEDRTDYDHAMFSLQSFLSTQTEDATSIAQSMKAEFLVRLGLLKKLSTKGKINAIVEHVEEVILSGEKIIIGCWYNDTVQVLKDALKQYNPVTISGKIDGRETTDEEIQVNKNLFNTSPDFPVMIITFGKGGEGHTLGAADHVAIAEMGWTWKDHGQLEDRAVIVGKAKDVLVTVFLGADTVDEHIYKVIESRRMVEKETTGGQEVVETTFASITRDILAAAKKNRVEKEFE